MSADLVVQPTTKKITEMDFVKYAKLKPHSVIIQKKFVNYSYDENGNQFVTKFQSQTNTNSLQNLDKGKSGQYNGYMSPATRRKVNGILENFLTAVQLNTSMTFPKSFPSTEVYPTFMTLTLPGMQYHCDNLIKEYFARFMEYLTGSKDRGNSGWNVKNYLWVAETQSNGHIHFHVILDRAVPAQRLQEEWNRVIERLGYVTWYRNRQEYIYQSGFYVRKAMLDAAVARGRDIARKTSQKFDLKATKDQEKKRQKEAYEKGVKCNWSNPPTTQVHSIKNIKSLTAYITKYMTKRPDIVTPDLAAGEKLVQENGHYFIETEAVEKFTSIEGLAMETVVIDKQPIEVKFKNRRLRGRIWGSSKMLHTDTVAPYTINLITTSRVTTTTYKTDILKFSEPKYTVNMLGERVYTHTEKSERVVNTPVTVTDFAPAVVDDVGERWVQWLTEEHVPQRDIDRATAAAGEHFSHYGGVIIPLDYPHKDLLKAYSPDLYTRYADHYRNMFETLYPVAQ